MQGKDVKDQSAAVNDLHAEHLLEATLLCWRELVIGDQHGEARLDLGGEQLVRLASANIGVGVGVSPLLPFGANNFSACRSSQAR